MSRIKRLCFFSAFFPPHTGGVERYVHDLSLKLLEMGCEIEIVTSAYDGNPGITEYRGMKIYRLPVFMALDKRFPIPRPNAEYRKIIDELKRSAPDIFVLNMRIYPLSVLGAGLTRKLGKPAILIEHVSGHFKTGRVIGNIAGHAYEHLATKYLKKRVDKFYGVSQAVCKWLEHFGIEADGVIYNGINADDTEPSPTDEITLPQPGKQVITFAGRLIKEKGILLLTEAFERLAVRHDNVELFVAGDGPLEEYLKAKYKSNEGIHILGQVSQNAVRQLLRRSAMAVIPSFYPEGLPTLILEAAVNKTAVIAAPMGGTREVITDENHGIITQPAAADLEHAMEKLLQDESLRNTLAENLHKRVIERFNWDVIGDVFLGEVGRM